MSVIIINCVTLGSYEPCLDEAECDNKCQILKAVDDVIYAYFAAEMIIKMVKKALIQLPIMILLFFRLHWASLDEAVILQKAGISLTASLFSLGI